MRGHFVETTVAWWWCFEEALGVLFWLVATIVAIAATTASTMITAAMTRPFRKLRTYARKLIWRRRDF